MPADTAQALTGLADADPGDSKTGRSGSSYDTVVARLVVEQGLATQDEVDHCLKQKVVATEDASARTLAQILIDNSFVTQRQVERLKAMAEAERSGQQIPGYRVLGKIGAGAMASVFKAKQISLDRLVAIKVLPRKHLSNQEFIERFYAEGRAAAQLNHPNVVQAFDVGQAGDFHYFVMEYVEGRTVHDMIAQHKRFKEGEALDIVIAIADALRHAHDRGLIHRDVKPKNIIITGEGTAKLADLGLARGINDKDAAMAEKGKAYGTPYYISPEQIRGEVSVGPQADIYSLGATLYHMLTGNVPFNGKSPSEVMQKHLKDALIAPDHVNPALSAGISEVIERMMAKSRRDRYKNCQELLTDLRAVRKGEQPPIAHKEASAHDLIALAEQAKTAPAAEIPVDRTTRPSPFADPSVKALVVGFGVVLLWALGMTVAFVTSL